MDARHQFGDLRNPVFHLQAREDQQLLAYIEGFTVTPSTLCKPKDITALFKTQSICLSRQLPFRFCPPPPPPPTKNGTYSGLWLVNLKMQTVAIGTCCFLMLGPETSDPLLRQDLHHGWSRWCNPSVKFQLRRLNCRCVFSGGTPSLVSREQGTLSHRVPTWPSVFRNRPPPKWILVFSRGFPYTKSKNGRYHLPDIESQSRVSGTG